MTTASKLMTTEEFLALPEEGMERWLLNGELRERPMTKRNRFHSTCVAMVALELGNWLRQQPKPHGLVMAGEAGVVLRRDPDTTVGVDVAYVSAEVIARQTSRTTLLEGIPTLAVEVLSPSDTVEEIETKVETYLSAGVPLVWLLDPRRRTVTVYQPGEEPLLFNVRQELTAEPHLPGFRVAVSQLFG